MRRLMAAVLTAGLMVGACGDSAAEQFCDRWFETLNQQNLLLAQDPNSPEWQVQFEALMQARLRLYADPPPGLEETVAELTTLLETTSEDDPAAARYVDEIVFYVAENCTS